MKGFKEFINETEMQKAAREKIKREKEADRIKHDRIMDTARRRDTVIANQREERSAQDPDIKDREGTQPAAYHKGLKKSTKAKRDAFFKKHGSKADNDASAYKDAPGDKQARQKNMPKSKYTKYVDKMMDEEVEFHVRLDHLDGDKRQKKANDVLRKHAKAGHINFHGETDKGIVFKAKSKSHADRLHRELKPHATGVDMNEACWDSHTQKGMKKKGGKMVPNCVPKEEIVAEEGGFAEKAKKSGISTSTLRKVYNRGVAAWKTGHRPGTTPQQWGHARVNAFIAKKKKGGLNHDKDLA